MNEIQVFNNDDFGSVRIVEEDGKILFCGADAAKALGYTNTRDAINRHCKEDGVVNHDVIDTLGRIQQAKFISQVNLYRLIAHSNLPAADAFESWIESEVIPSVVYKCDAPESIVSYQNQEFGEIRTSIINGEPWFVAADVCDAFGEKNRNRAMQDLADDEKGYTQIATPGGMQKMAIVNEPGLYALLFAMKPEKARGVTEDYIGERIKKLKSFKRWIIHEVLPSIRKTGSYSIRPEPTDFERMNAETANLNAKAAVFEHWMRLSDALDTPQHHQICAHYASGVLAGHPVLPLPKVDRSYSATEVASMLGITAHKVGMLANKHGLKTDQYGYWVMDKSAHSSKEVSSFRYNDLAIDFLRNLQ